MTIPSAFVSYAWESDSLKAWVKDLARRLRGDRVEALLDVWETRPGDLLTGFMETGIAREDFVLIICTPAYREKAMKPHGGVSYEGSVMTGELVTGTTRRKFVPLLRGHDWPSSAPPWLLGSFYIDFRGEPYAENSYQELLDTLLDRREGPPEVGATLLPQVPPRSMEQVASPTKGTLAQSDSEGWPFVWKQLRDVAPYDEELVAEGVRWLHEHPESDGWSYVWEDLIRAEPYSHELRFLGTRWLHENVDSRAWPFVWRRMMQSDPHSQDLLELGKRHISRR